MRRLLNLVASVCLCALLAAGPGAPAAFGNRVANKTGGGGFTPPAGTFAWFKADAITGLSNNDPVSTWEDSEGSNDATNTGSARPIYKTNVQNSLPGVEFDGSNDYLASSAFGAAETQPNTVHFVAKVASTSGSQYILDGGSSGRHMVYFDSGLGAIKAYAGSFMNGTGSSYSDTSAHQITVVFDGASSAIYIDGSAQGTGDVGAGSMSLVTLGATGDLGGFGAVTLFEVLWRAGGRDTATESYLKSKWGTP